MYAVYDLKENEQCIGVFDTAKEVAEYFNTTTATIYCDITRKSLVKHRYEIVKIDRQKRIQKNEQRRIKKEKNMSDRTCKNCGLMCAHKQDKEVCEHHKFESQLLYAKLWENIENWRGNRENIR